MTAQDINAASIPPSPRQRRTLTLLACILGVLLGIGGYTFRYAEGLSYFSANPAACVNCHIMRPQYDSWQKSSHHSVATCVDCHLPHDPVGKYMAKADNGYHHSKAFTLQNFHEPIQITEGNAQILEANCVACHSAIVDEMVEGMSGRLNDMRCVKCHAGVGHGDAVGLGGPARFKNEERLDL